MKLDTRVRTTLLSAARHAIEQGLAGGKPVIENRNPDPVLREPHASFVTLKRHAALRGCIGTLEAKRPLLEDVIHNAEAAAFKDPRFPPLTTPELESLRIEISVLSVPELITAHSRAELLRLLKPGEDGLIVQEGTRRATYLPAVWESLRDASSFYEHLMQKAGLGAAHWSTTLRFFRYSTDSFNNEGKT